MFVNVSMTDRNLEETRSSLRYAVRVRTIKNTASKNESSKYVEKMKYEIRYWRTQAGLAHELRDSYGLSNIADKRQ